MLENSIWIAALLYIVLMLLWFRRTIGRGGIIVPPIVMAVLVFTLFAIIVFFAGWSSLHLIWLLILSFVIGTMLLIFPIVQSFLFAFLELLALTVLSFEPDDEPSPQKQRLKKKQKQRNNKRRKTK